MMKDLKETKETTTKTADKALEETLKMIDKMKAHEYHLSDVECERLWERAICRR